jgi:esterase
VPDVAPVSLHAARYDPPDSSGAPLVLLHGFLGSGGNWHTLARRFAGRHRVLVPDARNHGRSPHAAPHTYAAMAADVATLLDVHGLDHATVLGHSMGGKTAMHLALTRPERVARLVVVDASPARSPSAHEDVLAALDAVDLDAATSRADVEAALAARLGDAGLRGWLLKSLLRTPEGGFRWALNVPVLRAALPEVGGALEPTLPPGWRPYAGPALFVRGGRSAYVPDAALPEIERLFPAAEVVTVPDAGHWVHAEQPEALFRLVEAFLS